MWRPRLKSQIKWTDIMASPASRTSGNATKPLPQRKKITTKGKGGKIRVKRSFWFVPRSFRFPSGVTTRLLPFVAVPVINCRRRKRSERTSQQRKVSKRADLPRTEGSGASGLTESERKRSGLPENWRKRSERTYRESKEAQGRKLPESEREKRCCGWRVVA